jgi:hypothetical protein
VLLGRAEEPEGRSAVIEATAEWLALPHRDVDPALARRLEHAEGHRIDRGDRHRARLVCGLGERRQVFDPAQEVRVLNEDGGRVLVERRRELARAGQAVLEPHLGDLGVIAVRVGFERLAAVRVKATRDDELSPPLPRAQRQVGG